MLAATPADFLQELDEEEAARAPAKLDYASPDPIFAIMHAPLALPLALWTWTLDLNPFLRDRRP